MAVADSRIAPLTTHQTSILLDLFPTGVVAAARRTGDDPSTLLPEEFALSARFSEKRRAEFTSGRLCAREAMRHLGLDDVALLRSEHRGPRWPTGIVGSITHTREYCAAVVADARRFAGIGVDAEITTRLTREIWRLVFTSSEIERLSRLPESHRDGVAAVIFSAKEAFYKCQSPITGMWIDFLEVMVDVLPLDRSGVGEFKLSIRSERVRPAFSVGSFAGMYRFLDDFCIAGISMKYGLTR